MTENEAKAIKWIKNVRDDAVVTLDHIKNNEPNVSPMLYAGRKEKAETIIAGFEELEQYRALEQRLQSVYGEYDGLLESVVNGLVQYENAPDKAKKAVLLTDEDTERWEKYQAVGTVEECNTAVEKIMKPKRAAISDYKNGTINYSCPVCKRMIISKINGEWCGGTFQEHCDRCGQAINWSEGGADE